MIQNFVFMYYFFLMYIKFGIIFIDCCFFLMFVNLIVFCIGVVFGLVINDMIGCCIKFWVGFIVFVCLFVVVIGFLSQFEGGVDNVDVFMSNVGVVFIFLFGCVYSFVYIFLIVIYCVEVLVNYIRVKGMGVVSLI